MPTPINYEYVRKLPTKHNRWSILNLSRALALPKHISLTAFMAEGVPARAWHNFRTDYLDPLLIRNGKDPLNPTDGDWRGLGSKREGGGGNYNRPVINLVLKQAAAAIRGNEPKFVDEETEKEGWERIDYYVRFCVEVVLGELDEGGRWEGEDEGEVGDAKITDMVKVAFHILDMAVWRALYSHNLNWSGDRGVEGGVEKGRRDPGDGDTDIEDAANREDVRASSRADKSRSAAGDNKNPDSSSSDSSSEDEDDDGEGRRRPQPQPGRNGRRANEGAHRAQGRDPEDEPGNNDAPEPVVPRRHFYGRRKPLIKTEGVKIKIEGGANAVKVEGARIKLERGVIGARVVKRVGGVKKIKRENFS